MPRLEYKISTSFGDWPEIFTDLQDVADDLEWISVNHPDAEFKVLQRETSDWELSIWKLPEPRPLNIIDVPTDVPTDPEFAHLEEGLDA